MAEQVRRTGAVAPSRIQDEPVRAGSGWATMRRWDGPMREYRESKRLRRREVHGASRSRVTDRQRRAAARRAEEVPVRPVVNPRRWTRKRVERHRRMVQLRSRLESALDVAAPGMRQRRRSR